jgi:hypothetical protein
MTLSAWLMYFSFVLLSTPSPGPVGAVGNHNDRDRRSTSILGVAVYGAHDHGCAVSRISWAFKNGILVDDNEFVLSFPPEAVSNEPETTLMKRRPNQVRLFSNHHN